jgi:hypothetical protein
MYQLPFIFFSHYFLSAENARPGKKQEQNAFTQYEREKSQDQR